MHSESVLHGLGEARDQSDSDVLRSILAVQGDFVSGGPGHC
jgi:hypothetical protein